MGTKQSTQTVYKLAQYRQRINKGAWGNWINIGNAVYTATDMVTLGSSVPNWRAKIANYENATSTLSGVRNAIKIDNTDSATVERFFAPLGAYQEDEIRGTFSAHGVQQVLPDASLFLITSVDNRVKSQLVSQIRSANTSLKGLVSAGEFGETVRFVNGAGRQLRKGVSDYLNDVSHLARTASPRRLIGIIGRRWLEYSFGLKPLIADIDDGIRAIRRLSESRLPRVLVRAQAESAEMNQPTVFAYTVPTFLISVRTMPRRTYGFKLYGCVSITPPSIARVSHEFGIKLDEFVPTIWELIPYSFLADYFVNIGAIIDACSLNTSGVRWLAYGRKRTGEIQTSISITPLANGWQITNSVVRNTSPYQHVQTRVERGPYFGGLIPTLEFKIPGTSTKWLNISALAAQHLDTTRAVRSRLRL